MRRKAEGSPTERKAQGPSGPTERKAQGPSGPTERKAQGPSGPAERKAQGPSGPAERKAQGPAPGSGNGRASADPQPASVDARLAAIEDALRVLASRDDELSDELGGVEARLLRLVEDVHEGTMQPPAGTDDDYADLVRNVRREVRRLVPQAATVAVISRGDEQLVRFFNRRGWHFPQGADGRWIGYHPSNSLAAIAQLESMRALGADHLVVPAVSSWWLEKYAAFAERLTSCYQEIPADPAVCRIFSLRRMVPEGRTVHDFLERLRSERGTVEVLDLTTDGDLAARALGLPLGRTARAPAVEAFRPLVPGPVLPYADRSIPVVAVDSDAPAVRAEAVRVATLAVLDLARDRVERVEEDRSTLPSVSVVMPVLDKPELTGAALESLLATLPAAFAGEVIVVDDGSAEATRMMLDGWQERSPLVRVIHNPRTCGYLASIMRGLETATGEYLLLVNNDMLFLDGWLEPLLRTFSELPDAGVVGGRLLYPDGRLQEAGGLLFADGSAAKYGYGDADIGRPGYTYLRPVDYCSGCLLLTPRAVFEDVGGFDTAFDPGYYEDTDYCLRVRMSGRRVYYQPESVVVHVEGGTAGMDLDTGMKRHQAINHVRFVEKWRATLRRLQPERPDPCDDAALHALVLRHTPAGTTGG